MTDATIASASISCGIMLLSMNPSRIPRRSLMSALAAAPAFAQKAFDPFRGPELKPGPEVQTDAEIDAFVRAHVESAYHPSCSCRMGTDSMAVVDGKAKVHGLEGLRVVDASIMPSIVSGNLNAPTIMLAEKLADTIRGREPLPASDAPVWIAPHWDTGQR